MISCLPSFISFLICLFALLRALFICAEIFSMRLLLCLMLRNEMWTPENQCELSTAGFSTEHMHTYICIQKVHRSDEKSKAGRRMILRNSNNGHMHTPILIYVGAYVPCSVAWLGMKVIIHLSKRPVLIVVVLLNFYCFHLFTL